jgi:hypothetical protein
MSHQEVQDSYKLNLTIRDCNIALVTATATARQCCFVFEVP